jgi:hypothetical protein
MKRYVRPSSRCRSFIRLRTCACTETSSADVGSSQTRNSGFVASARDRQSLPLAAGKLVRVFLLVGGCQLDVQQQLVDPCSNLRPVAHQAVRDQRLGDDVANAPARIQAGGSWKIICSFWRRLRPDDVISARSCPKNSTRPRVGV